MDIDTFLESQAALASKRQSLLDKITPTEKELRLLKLQLADIEKEIRLNAINLAPPKTTTSSGYIIPDGEQKEIVQLGRSILGSQRSSIGKASTEQMSFDDTSSTASDTGGSYEERNQEMVVRSMKSNIKAANHNFTGRIVEGDDGVTIQGSKDNKLAAINEFLVHPKFPLIYRHPDHDTVVSLRCSECNANSHIKHNKMPPLLYANFNTMHQHMFTTHQHLRPLAYMVAFRKCLDAGIVLSTEQADAVRAGDTESFQVELSYARPTPTVPTSRVHGRPPAPAKLHEITEVDNETDVSDTSDYDSASRASRMKFVKDSDILNRRLVHPSFPLVYRHHYNLAKLISLRCSECKATGYFDEEKLRPVLFEDARAMHEHMEQMHARMKGVTFAEAFAKCFNAGIELKPFEAEAVRLGLTHHYRVKLSLSPFDSIIVGSAAKRPQETINPGAEDFTQRKDDDNIIFSPTKKRKHCDEALDESLPLRYPWQK